MHLKKCFMTRCFVIHLVIFFVLVICISSVVFAKDELRGFWVDAFGNGFLSKAEVEKLVSDARKMNINSLFIEVRKNADAYYKSAYEPMASNIIDKNGFDPLGEIIKLAHNTSNGEKYIAVHAWFIVYRSSSGGPKPENHINNLHPDWLSYTYDDKQAENSQTYLDPALPEVQDYLIEVFSDAVRNYDIDGIHFDRIRYDNNKWGYHPRSIEMFNSLYNRQGKPEPQDPQWSQFRRDQITGLVKRAYATILSIKPDIVFSIAAIPWGRPTSNFKQTDAYASVFQDWQSWLSKGYIDMLCMMDYKRVNDDFVGWMNVATQNRNNRSIVIGLGNYLIPISQSIEQIKLAQANADVDGILFYSYRATNNESKANDIFYSTVKEQVFSDYATPPQVEWKTNPDLVILSGQIKTNHKALLTNSTITLENLGKSTEIDNSGFFVLTDVDFKDQYILVVTLNNGEAKKFNIAIQRKQKVYNLQINL